MDDDEGAYGEVGDRGDHFHRNEAISAVADDGLLGEEDDDYEDLYNDVNVGENFLQSMRKSEEVGLKSEPVVERMYEQPTPPPPVAVAAGAPPSGGLGAGEGGTGGDSGYPNQGFRGADVTGPSGSGPMVGGGGGIRVELAQRQPNKVDELDERSANNNVLSVPQGFVQQSNGIAGMNPGNAGPLVGVGNDGLPSQGGVRNMNPVGGNGDVSAGGSVSVVAGAGAGTGTGASAGSGAGGGGGTMLFVGDLHWWTTDAELEAEVCKYGQVKEVKFFDEKASGKSKGYCQVEFFDPAAATACKEGMNGHLFNGRACVVAFASPYSIKRMGEAQMNRNQQMPQSAVPGQGRRGMNDVGPKTGGNNMAAGGNIQGGDNNRGFGRGNWGRGNAQGMGNRGAMGPMRNRGAGMGGRGLMGNGGGGFGQGMGGAPPLMPPQSMMAQGFDPAFGGPMGRLGGYGGFPGAPAPPFSGLLPSFPPVGGFGMPGVAPHVNPAVFGRGMPMNGMGMMPGSGVEGPNAGMWSDNSMGGWGGEDHGGGRAGESSYGEEAASEHQYGEAAHDRGGWQNSSKEKERGTERDWSGSSDRRYQDDREMAYERDAPRDKEMGRDREWSQRRHREDRDSGWERPEKDRDHDRDGERPRDRERERSRDRVRERDRDRERERERERERHREDRDRHSDHHRHRDHDPEHDDDYYEKGRPSRSHTKSRLSQEDDHRSRSREADYGKRRRLTSE